MAPAGAGPERCGTPGPTPTDGEAVARPAVARRTVTVRCILAAHNRRDLTVRAIRQLQAQSRADIDIRVTLTDDGSTDGTAQAARSLGVEVVPGTGDLYWGGGMALAERAVADREGDFLLWANDDVDLDPDAVPRLIRTWAAAGEPDTVVAGAMRDPRTGVITYGGWRRDRSWRWGLRLRAATPDHEWATPVDTFNGNLVLVPWSVVRSLGGIDERFRHHYGDFDYGLRVRARGVPVLLAPGTFGGTSRNSRRGTFADPTVRRSERFRRLVGVKGFPPAEKARYLRRHGGALWPAQWAGFYLFHTVRILAGW
jgi:GT2 family glycosyltransferase